MAEFSVAFSGESAFGMTMRDTSERFTMDMGTTTAVHAGAYRGTYTVTPSEEAQTLATEGFYLENNVMIDPIPSNYGRITWNGSTLTVY